MSATQTPNLGLTYLVPSQAQPEVPINDAWNRIDAGIAAAAGSITVGSIAAVRQLNISGATITAGAAGVANVAITAGGGVSASSGGNMTPDTHPASPSSLDDEFEGTALDPKWTQRATAGSVAYSLEAGSLLMEGASGSFNHNNTISQPILAPGSPWRFRTKQRIIPLLEATFTGIWFGQASTGKGYYFGRWTGFPIDVMVNLQNDWLGTGVASPQAPGSYGYQTGGYLGPDLYLDVRYDGTDFYLSVSADGVNFTLYGAAIPAAGFVPDAVGLFGGTATLSPDCTAAVSYDWFRDYSLGYTPSSGGEAMSGGTANVTPDTHPVTANAMNDEFETATLDPKWTVINAGGSATIEQIDGSLHIVAPTDGSNGSDNLRIVRAIEQPVPSGNWQIRAKIRTLCAGNFNLSGIWLRSATGAAYFCLINHASIGNPYVGTQTYPICTTHGDPQINDSVSFSENPLTKETKPLYLDVSWDGTTLTFSLSSSGFSDAFVMFYAPTAAALLGAAPVAIGLCALAISGTTPATLYCDWFRRIA